MTPTLSVGARVRVVDTSLYGAQHEVGTVKRVEAGEWVRAQFVYGPVEWQEDDRVLVQFMCRCQVASAAGYSETYRSAHDLWFPTWEVEPA